MASLSVRFDRGTLEVEGDAALDGVIVDARSRSRRTPASRFGAIAAWADANERALGGDLRTGWSAQPRSRAALDLRPYQEQALTAWTAFGRRGVVALPTGAGKSRVAMAASLEAGLPTAVLVPTRALAAQWLAELGRWLGEPIGLVGDGRREVKRTTVFTFESAYRYMDTVGDRFGFLVVDEVHHLGGNLRIEALESCAAIARLGLTATPPDPSDDLSELVGPVVYELGLESLVGTHLANLRLVRETVRLDPVERADYLRLTRSFRELSRAFFASTPGGDYVALSRALGRSPDGRRALRDRAEGEKLASFPAAKRARVRELLTRHRTEKSVVFTAFAENAYAIGTDNLVPVIAAETSARERLDVLRRFQEGPLQTIVAARVLNEGIDVPDASIAIIVAGTLGRREHIQRIGRVLRPRPGKEAIIYELVTAETLDVRRAARRVIHAPRSTP